MRCESDGSMITEGYTIYFERAVFQSLHIKFFNH